MESHGEELRPSPRAGELEAAANAALTAREHIQLLAAESLRLREIVGRSAERTDGLVAEAKRLRDELEDIVGTHARLMYQLGRPAEEVVVLMKEIIDAAGRDVYVERRILEPSRITDIRDEIVRLSISAYYGGNGDPRPE